MKIGILTHYYGSHNYGGLLQSYALPTAINGIFGADVAQQIPCAYMLKPRTGLQRLLRYQKTSVWMDKLASIRFQRLHKEEYDARSRLFTAFRDTIPHGEYIALRTQNQWRHLNEDFDAFIVGSDQVWNPNWFYEPFYLTFARENKLKIAYSASMGVSKWNNAERAAILPLIKRFDHISVREKATQQLLHEAGCTLASQVCDPVWLLDTAQWDSITSPSPIDAPYVYAYLLGSREVNRTIATYLAQMLHLPLATVPYVHLQHNRYDATFGQYPQPQTDPGGFLGLIRDSAYVVTDSYHGVLFALLHQKPFVVVLRHQAQDAAHSDSRIRDLLEELHLSQRIVTTKQQITAEFLEEYVDFDAVQSAITQKKAVSLAFLKRALELPP